MQNRIDTLVNHVYEIFTRKERDNAYVYRVVRTSLASANHVSVFLNGREINPATGALIASANEEVLIQLYNFDSACEAAIDIKEALISLNAKASRDKKIKINILVNYRKGPAAFFTRKAEDPFDWLQQDEGGIYIYFNNQKNYLNHLEITTKLHVHYFFDSYHSKQIIVDRRTLMLRTGDITRPYDCRDGVKRQTEVATVIEEKSLATLAAVSFDERWSGGEPVFTKHCSVPGSEENDGRIPVLLLQKKNSTNLLERAAYISPYKIAMIEGLRHAEKNVTIMTPNINDEDIIAEIILALKRGITVRIYTGKYGNDKKQNMPGMGGGNLASVTRIFESVPAVYWDNCQVYWACDETRKLIEDGSTKMMHGKVTVIDDKAVLAGSSPLDKQSAYFSEECDVLMVSPDVAKKYLDIIEPACAAGEHFNYHSLVNLKTLLTRDIHAKFSQDALSEANGHHDCTHQIICMEALIGSIRQSKNFSGLMAILRLSVAIVESNPLAHVRAIGFFGHTIMIKDLKALYLNHGVKISDESVHVAMSRINW